MLSGDEFHHLRHVLRLKIGDTVTLCDYQNKEYRGTIAWFSASSAEIEITHVLSPVSPQMSLTLAQSLLKGQKMDFVVEKATELGVSCIMPVVSTFTVAQLSHERRGERLARWQRIAQSAAKQSGNPVPQIFPPRPFRALLDAIPPESGKILLYEREQNLTLKTFAQTHPIFSSLYVMVGPEGGFTEEEVARAQQIGFQTVGLGPQILRAETASLAAVVLCRFLWGGVELPPLL